MTAASFASPVSAVALCAFLKLPLLPALQAPLRGNSSTRSTHALRGLCCGFAAFRILAPPKNEPNSAIFPPHQNSSPWPGEQTPLTFGLPARTAQERRQALTEEITVENIGEIRERECSTALSDDSRALAKPESLLGEPSWPEPYP
jgi:hypothetical protein